MSRIRPDRPGYTGYTCTGITYSVISPQDCTGNKYKQVPPQAKGAVSEVPWENLSPLDNDSRLDGINKSCGGTFDPFDGVFVDLYTAMKDNGLDSVIADNCFESDGRYTEGYMNPSPIFPGCSCGTS